MKKAYLIISLFAVSLIAGCGGPNYANGFKEWLAMDMAKQKPMKLIWVKIEPIVDGKTQAAFKFKGELEITENLYGPADAADTAPATAALQKMREANVPIPQQNEVISIYNSITILPVYKVVTPKGKRIPISGSGGAELQNNGKWEYGLFDGGVGSYEGRKEPTGKWALEGSKEAKENAAAVQEKVTAVVAAADKAIQEAREAQMRDEKFAALVAKKEAEAAQAVKNEALALCAPGSQLLGRWQGDIASGDIGIRFGSQTEIGDHVAVTGILFDPKNTQYEKPFDGKILKSDAPSIPFQLIISVANGNGGVKIPPNMRAEDPAINNKTVGLLTVYCQYDIKFDLAPKKLVGKLFWGNRAVGGNPIHFQFNKGDSPIGTPQGGSSFNPVETPAPSQVPVVSKSDIPPDLTGPPQSPNVSPVPQVNAQQPQSGGQLQMVLQMIDAGNADGAAAIVDALSQKAASLNAALLDATNAGDNAKAQNLLATLNRDYPAARQTLVWGFVQAVARKDKEGAASYWQIIQKYPFEQKDRDQLSSLYQKLQ